MRPMGRLRCRLLVGARAGWLPAVGAGSSVPLSRWTLSVDGGPEDVPVELPGRVDTHLPTTPTHHAPPPEGARDALPQAPLSLVIPHFEGLVELYVDGEHTSAAQYEPIEDYRHAG